MLLSGQDIYTQRCAGNIVIEPYQYCNLGTAQYDVTLGEYFYRETDRGGKDFDRIYNPYDEACVTKNWTLHQATPHKSHRELIDDLLKNIDPDDKIILIQPGEMILAHTVEFIGGKNFITTMMKARSSMGRNHIEVCKCAGMGDVGYFNRWTMEITNNSPTRIIPLVVGRRIAQILFFDVRDHYPTGMISQSDYSLSGKYQTNSHLEQLMSCWTPESMLPKQWEDREVK